MDIDLKEKLVKGLKAVAPLALLALPILAQDPVGAAAQSASTSVVTDVRYFGIIILAVSGVLFALDHEHGIMKKLFGVLFGLTIAFFATPLISWLQGI